MTFHNWRDMEKAGKVRAKRNRPPYRHVIVREALRKIGVRFKDYVALYMGPEHDHLLYLDFLIRTKQGQTVCILWSNKHKRRVRVGYRFKSSHSGLKPRERIAWQHKLEYLEEHDIPYIILSKRDILSSDEYRVTIMRWLTKIKNG